MNTEENTEKIPRISEADIIATFRNWLNYDLKNKDMKNFYKEIEDYLFQFINKTEFFTLTLLLKTSYTKAT